MRLITASEIRQTLNYPELIARLHSAFREGGETPRRHHHIIRSPRAEDATLLLMPSWRASCSIGVKMVTVFAGNPKKGFPTIQGVYVLLDGRTGRPRAVLEGAELTRLRTAAASALASRLLSRPDSSRLLMVGAGALAPELIEAHATVRPLRWVAVWNRHPEKAERLADQLGDRRFQVEAVRDLAAAARKADVISCATPSLRPLVRGEWLKAGCHLDLVGGFTPEMRETDDQAVLRARLFVDTREGALSEAGDLLDPIRRGVISAEDVEADLPELCRKDSPWPRNPDDVTLFKSVGSALEDLAAAELAAGL